MNFPNAHHPAGVSRGARAEGATCEAIKGIVADKQKHLQYTTTSPIMQKRLGVTE